MIIFFFLMNLVFLNSAPIIGIVTMPSDFPDRYSPSQYSYFGAAYVKYLESAGGKVIPILYDYDDLTLFSLLNKINGVLIPGGDASLWENEAKMEGFSQFTKTIMKIINWAIDQNEKGNFFPIWGTCLGYEVMIMSISMNDKVLGHFNSSNHHGNLSFLERDSRMYKNLDEGIKEYSKIKAPAFLWHHYGKSYDSFINNEILNDNFNILTTTRDFNDNTFVSSIEHKRYPFYATQYHPEVAIFMHGKKVNANHEKEAILLSQHLANFFLDECKKNRNHFNNEEEEKKYLIYKYAPESYLDNFYEQAYLIPRIQNKRKVKFLGN